MKDNPGLPDNLLGVSSLEGDDWPQSEFFQPPQSRFPRVREDPPTNPSFLPFPEQAAEPMTEQEMAETLQ